MIMAAAERAWLMIIMSCQHRKNTEMTPLQNIAFIVEGKTKNHFNPDES